jgi:hypothetical protein
MGATVRAAAVQRREVSGSALHHVLHGAPWGPRCTPGTTPNQTRIRLTRVRDGPARTLAPAHEGQRPVDASRVVGFTPLALEARSGGALEVVELGTSGEGRTLYGARIGDGDTRMWIQGRIHGNEPYGAEAITRYPDIDIPEAVDLVDDARGAQSPGRGDRLGDGSDVLRTRGGIGTKSRGYLVRQNVDGTWAIIDAIAAGTLADAEADRWADIPRRGAPISTSDRFPTVF